MMDYHKWLTFGILITIGGFSLAAPSWIGQSSPTRLNVTLTSIKQWLWKTGELATWGQKDGSAVVEYTWTVKDIEDKITKAKHVQTKIFSPPFYTDVPGYRFGLKLYLYDQNSSYIGVYVETVLGQFDDLVSWPFENIIELSSAGPDGTTFVHKAIRSPNDCNGEFYRPPYKSEDCGTYGYYFDIDTLLSNKTRYLINGALNIDVTIHLDN